MINYDTENVIIKCYHMLSCATYLAPCYSHAGTLCIRCRGVARELLSLQISSVEIYDRQRS